MAQVGDLVRTTDGRWKTLAPTHCGNGHRLGPNRSLVGNVSCMGHGGGHTTWTCRACDDTVYGPALNTHCRVRTGPDER